MSSLPTLSIITPSYNMLGYLKRCCRSVADQKGVPLEHIVIDGDSTDGTPDWLSQQERVRGVSEPDQGMYDAINKGMSMAQGQILAYLNCDEQYLPGTLRYVASYFETHPDVDMIFGDALLVRPNGSLLAYRKAYQPRWFFILPSHLYVLTCTMFFRRRIVKNGFQFDPTLSAVGDLDFVLRLLRNNYRIRYVRRYLAAFTMTGSNLGASEITRRETRQALQAAPWWIRAFRHPLNGARLLEKFISGAYWQRMPLRYALYPSTEATERQLFTMESASFRWATA